MTAKEITNIRILKLHHPKGHPYWQQGEYKIQLPDGTLINPANHITDTHGGYRVYWDESGVWVQICAAGSGFGKVDRPHIPPILLVNKSEYDQIELVGKPLKMAESLLNEINESEWCDNAKKFK